MRQIHEIKLNKEFANAVLSGDKCFEVRYNDRGYQKGDIVKFKVVDNCGCETVHALSRLSFEITYVLYGWGLKEDFVAFGIKRIPENEEK